MKKQKRLSLVKLEEILNSVNGEYFQFTQKFDRTILGLICNLHSYLITNVNRNNSKSERNGEFGLYGNQAFLPFIYLLSIIKPKRVLDCGAGIGAFNLIAGDLLWSLGIRVNFHGYENHLHYVDRRVSNIIHKDLFSITDKEIKDIDVFYFWEPIRDREMANAFFDKLRFNMKNPQWVICRSSHFRSYLKERKIKFLEFNDYVIATNISTCPDTLNKHKKVASVTHGDLTTH